MKSQIIDPQNASNNGERMVPAFHKGQNVYGAHIGRYKTAAPFVENKIVLDIACGSGYGTKLMSAEAKKVYGVDIDETAINYAKSNYAADNIIYKKGNGASIPLEDNSVDTVVSYETIEHITDYKKFLAEIKRVLKPDGCLILSTPNDEEYPKGNHFHYHEFKRKELATLLKNYFKNIDEYFQTYWLFSTILPEASQTKEWESDMKVINTCPLQPDKCIYFFMVCSDIKIDTKINQLGVIGEHYSPMSVYRNNKISNQTASDLKDNNEKLKLILQTTQNRLNEIEKSKAWKFAKSLRTIKETLASRQTKRQKR